MVSRLMVMAKLLTYRLDIPQEGRFSIAVASGSSVIELRLAVMPTSHGLRAAVRLPAELTQSKRLDTLNLPAQTMARLHAYLRASAGMLILTGPAGSGKTTTVYALLEELMLAAPGLSVISLEDPVERDIEGVTQIEVTPFGELTYEKALRSILRQDPQVLALGEIRDSATALTAAQAAMSGHRLISTLHAATPGGAIVRLLEMGLEPYQLTSSLFGVVSLRLLRQSDGECGYGGRLPVAAFALMNDRLHEAVLSCTSAHQIDALLATDPSYESLEATAARLVEQNLTDVREIRRVLGSNADLSAND